MTHRSGSYEVWTINAAIIWLKELRQQLLRADSFKALALAWTHGFQRPSEWVALTGGATHQADLLVLCLFHIFLCSSIENLPSKGSSSYLTLGRTEVSTGKIIVVNVL